MSKNQFKFSFLFVIMITLTSSINISFSQDSGFDQIDLGPGFESDTLGYKYGFYNGNLSTSTEYSEFLKVLNDNFGGHAQIEAITNTLLTDTSSDTRVTILFNEVYNSTATEISVLTKYLEEGRSLLYLTQPGNSSKSAQKFVDDLFKTSIIQFSDYQLNGSVFDLDVPYIISSDFNSPRTPVTANLTKLLIPNTVGMQINSTAVSETNLTIKDIYPIIYDKDNNILGVAVELKTFGRIIFLGSRTMMSDNVLLHENEFEDFVSIDNSDFILNAMTWLGRASGYTNKYSHSTNVNPLQTIDRGDLINASVTLKDSYNQSITDAEIKLELEIFNGIVDSAYMYFDGEQYFGELSNKNSKEGNYNEIRISISKRGFVDQSFLIGRVYIAKDVSGSIIPNFTILSVMAAAIVVFIMSFVLIWQNFNKIDA